MPFGRALKTTSAAAAIASGSIGWSAVAASGSDAEMRMDLGERPARGILRPEEGDLGPRVGRQQAQELAASVPGGPQDRHALHVTRHTHDYAKNG